MKISFIIPAANLKRHPIYRFINKIYGPSNSITGPLILGKILANNGHEVSVYEELEEDIDLNEIINSDVVGIYTMSSNAIRAFEIADFFRENNVRVIIGGIHASVQPEECLKHADQVVIGEAEDVIIDCVEGRLLKKIVQTNPVMDLDSIPFPDYSLLKTKSKAANILTSRGCPNYCTFCTTVNMFEPYRTRSIENVLEEMRMYKNSGFKYCNFQDDNLTAEPERIKMLCREIIKEKLFFKEIFFFGRVDMAEDKELLELLYKAKFRRVLVGFESVNQATLDAVKKDITEAEIYSAATTIKNHGIKVIASLIMGLDTDTIADIKKSIDFTIKTGTYQLQSAILTPYPGTELTKELESQNRILSKDWQHYDMITTVIKPKNFSAWQLQNMLFNSLCRFYSLSSLYPIVRAFGLEAAYCRLGLWFIMQLARIYFQVKSRINDGNYYYWLKQQ